VHTESRRLGARVQGAILVALCVAIAATVFVRLQRPFDRDTLDIRVSQLQSQAAEAQLLADNARADQLAPGFVRQHAQQMADKVDSVNAKLEKSGQQDVAAQQTTARRLGLSLHDALLRFGRDGSARQDFGFDRMAQALDAVHKQLRPAGAG
jgi:hypothetical protein